MTKEVFIICLKDELKDIEVSELNKSIVFYEEAISDRMEDGMTEEEAVRDLGLITDIVNSIKEDAKTKNKITQYTNKVVNKVKSTDNRNILWIVVLIIASPMIFSVIVTIGSLIFSVYATLFGLIIAGPILGIVTIVTMISSNFLGMIFFIGIWIMLMGVCIMLIPLMNKFSMWVIDCFKRLFKFIVQCIKGETTI